MATTARDAWGSIRTYRPLIVDILVAALLLGFSYRSGLLSAAWESQTYAEPFAGLPGFTVSYTIWCLLAFVVLSLASTKPVWVCWAVPTLLVIHLVFFPVTPAATVVTCFAMFHLGRFAPPRWRVPAWLGAMAGTGLAIIFRIDLARTPAILATVAAIVWMVLGFFWFLGTRSRSRDLEMKSLRDRAALAAISERTRIAREMHDIVAHSLTAIIVQADGGRYAGKKDPAQALTALDTIAGTARQSLDQMRDLLSVLREPDSDPGNGAGDGAEAKVAGAAGSHNRQASPGLVTLPQLIREVEATGLNVTLTEEGERYRLDPTKQLTVYRIVQECLTNALRYSSTSAAEVHLTWGARELVVVVHNTVDADRPFTWGSGRGLTGIRERAELHGGRIEVDQRDGFTVTARIPRK